MAKVEKQDRPGKILATNSIIRKRDINGNEVLKKERRLSAAIPCFIIVDYSII